LTAHWSKPPVEGVSRNSGSPLARERRKRETLTEVTHPNLQRMALYPQSRLQAIQVVSLAEV
jgi:hypothetical protein